MLISTRGRYALRVMLDLAQHQSDGYIAMKKVAERQGLSLKYIERIMPILSKNNYVEGVHGKG
ncbi:MAG: Rrf2 family transcriptional regulator, partial [Clostridia bacterium]|nr:Rrf2 family transcriptional regulator [Clostridia bacterium]